MTTSPDSFTRFPRGLIQPQGSFRFSEDALLLAAFAMESVLLQETSPASFRRLTESPWIDLGTGCGVVGLAALLLAGLPPASDRPDTAASVSTPSEMPAKPFCCGLDYSPELVKAARDNARNLGLEQYFTAELVDFASPEWPHEASMLRKLHGRASLVLANPPWRLKGSGRMPVTASRRNALFGDVHTFPLFVRAAASLLDSDGHFVCVIGSARLPDMLAALQDMAFNLLRMRFVHPSEKAPAVWVLIEARRTGHTPLQTEAPLILYDPDGRPSAASLEFCPFLR